MAAGGFPLAALGLIACLASPPPALAAGLSSSSRPTSSRERSSHPADERHALGLKKLGRRQELVAGAVLSKWRKPPASPPAPVEETLPLPGFKWALMHNWLHNLAFSLCVPVLPRIVASVVDQDGSSALSPSSSEALDKLLTFLFVGFLGCLSDVVGRKPLMAYAALGQAIACLMQSEATHVSLLIAADVIDGASSCMNSVCQAFVTDASGHHRRIVNLAVFQGLSIAGAFIVGFPLSSLIKDRWGDSAPVRAAALVGFVNFALAAFLTPESLPASQRVGKKLKLAVANPIGTVSLLFRANPLLRGAALSIFLFWFANACMGSHLSKLVSHLFDWRPADYAPLLVLSSLMVAIVPPFAVPLLNLRHSIELGILLSALGLFATALAASERAIIFSVLFTSLGCGCAPALLALITSQAHPADRGALLGGLQTLQELCLYFAYSSYPRVFSHFVSEQVPQKLPGAAFIVAAFTMLASLGVIKATFFICPDTIPKLL